MTNSDLTLLLTQAREFRERREFNEALSLFDEARHQFADNGAFLSAHALTLAEAGMGRSANTLMERALEASPEDLAIHLDAARLHLVSGNTRRALELCAKARGLGYTTALLASIEGDAHYQVGRLSEASASYEEALRIEPGHEAGERLRAARKRLGWLEAARKEPLFSADARMPAARKHSANPPISVVIPTWRNEREIGRLLQSLALQSFADFDVHLVDDASDDGTLNEARSWGDALGITIHTGAARTGRVANLNRALSVGEAPYILLANPTDIFGSRYIEALYERLDRQPETALCCAGALYLNAGGGLVETQPPLQAFETDPEKPVESALIVMRHYSEANQFFGLYRRAALAKAGDVPSVHGGDHVHMFSVAMNGRIAYVDEPLYFRRVLEGDLDRNSRTDRAIRDFSIDERHGVARDSVFSSLDYLTPFIDMAWAHVEAAARAPVAPEHKRAIMEAIPGVFRYRFGSFLEDDMRRVTLFLDENERRIPGLMPIAIRSRIVENVLSRIMRARALMPANRDLDHDLRRIVGMYDRR